MQQIGQIQPDTRQTTHSGMHSETWAMEKEKAKQIMQMTRQLFAMQDTYGLKPKDLVYRMEAMVVDLASFPLKIIQDAFTEWRRTSPKIPTPFDILDTIEKLKARARRDNSTGFMKLDEFRQKKYGDWPEYKAYLQKNGYWLAA